MYSGEHIPPNKVAAHHLNDRFRLGAKLKDEEGVWFDFENAKTEEEFEKVASSVLVLLNTSDRLWISKLLN